MKTLSIIPAAFSKLFRSEVDWNYLTEPQAELGGRQIYWPRGKCLGGSSSLNATMAIPGHLSDYDDWPAGNRFETSLQSSTWERSALMLCFFVRSGASSRPDRTP